MGGQILMSEFPFSFAFITDPQIGINSRFGLHGPQSDVKRFEFAIDYVNEHDLDFVIFGGDQIHNRDSDEQMDAFLECVAKIQVPCYGCVGNHEQYHPDEGPSLYLERGGPERFTFTHKRCLFIGLNSSWLRGDFGEEYQRMEWDYLKAGFAQATDDLAHRFVVMHWPLFAVHPGEEDTYWNMPNRSEIVDCFKDNNVSCFLAGHWQQDIDAAWKGIPLVCSVGTSLPLQYPEELSFKVVTVFEDGWSARRVSVEQF